MSGSALLNLKTFVISILRQYYKLSLRDKCRNKAYLNCQNIWEIFHNMLLGIFQVKIIQSFIYYDMYITLKYMQIFKKCKKFFICDNQFGNYSLLLDSKMSSGKKPLIFTTLKECPTTRARVSKLVLPHGVVDTPVFMPVGTQVNLQNHFYIHRNNEFLGHT